MYQLQQMKKLKTVRDRSFVFVIENWWLPYKFQRDRGKARNTRIDLKVKRQTNHSDRRKRPLPW